MAEKKDLAPLRQRRGRPPADQVGEVDGRILDAAADLFLSLGFGRTTLDAVAKRAQVGNTTLYKRYPSKEPLFTAVVHRSVEQAVARFGQPAGAGSARERLRETGLRMAENAMTREVVAIMRVSAAEAESFPAVARDGYRIGFDASIELAARAIAGSDDPGALRDARRAATRFVELALHPLEMQGMFGIPLETLRSRIQEFVDEAIAALVGTGLLPG